MNGPYLDFEKPIFELERRISDLKDLAGRDRDDPSQSLNFPMRLRPWKGSLKSFPERFTPSFPGGREFSWLAILVVPAAWIMSPL